MRAVGRNEPCPCGSGLKYKRCCLEIEQCALRVAAAAEARIVELGGWLRQEHRPAWVAAYERNIGSLNRFGMLPAEFAAWLDLWLVCDEPVVGGRTALEAVSGSQPAEVDRWLRRSSLAGWWMRGCELPLAATPWRAEEPLLLHCRQEPLGALTDGGLLIGRGVEVRDGHVALIGRPVVVEDAVVGDVVSVLNRAPSQALFAALRWPEWREHTAEGERVQSCYRSYSLADPQAAIAALREDSIASERDVVGYWEDDVTFAIHGPRVTTIIKPAPEPGVVWDLCDEDCGDDVVLGELTISPADAELHLTAPTRSRGDRLIELLPPVVRAQLGALLSDDLDAPDGVPRMSRMRLEALAA